MAATIPPTLRALMMGRPVPGWHVSKAIVHVSAHTRSDLVLRLPQLGGVEVHASDPARILITIEGPGTAFVWETLGTIAQMDGVTRVALDRAEEKLAS